MKSRLKKISIANLKVGMFVVEMDIPWIQTPFLLHRRAIKSENDIALLKKSGVKVVTIDLDKSHYAEEQSEKSIFSGAIQAETQKINHELNNIPEQTAMLHPSLSPESLDNPSVSLDEELKQASLLKKQAYAAFQQIHELVKNHQSITRQDLEPIVDETINSLLRNSQALLTLLHLKRFEEKIFSHSFSVMSLTLTLAIKEGFEQKDLAVLGLAALLHDIGWAQLPLNLFGKSKPYSKNELIVVQQHLQIADLIMGKSNTIPVQVKNLMSQHHERLDGSGYPHGIKEDQQNRLSRLLSIADYYDELVHGLLDRPGLIPSEALRVLYKDAHQKKLDGSLVEVLIKMLGIYPLTSVVELNSGEKGVVVEIHREKPLVPKIKIIYNAEGNALMSPLIVDLKTDKYERYIKNTVSSIEETNDPNYMLAVEDD